MTGFDEMLDVRTEVGIYGDGKACLPVTGTRIILTSTGTGVGSGSAIPPWIGTAIVRCGRSLLARLVRCHRPEELLDRLQSDG